MLYWVRLSLAIAEGNFCRSYGQTAQRKTIESLGKKLAPLSKYTALLLLCFLDDVNNLYYQGREIIIRVYHKTSFDENNFSQYFPLQPVLKVSYLVEYGFQSKSRFVNH